MSNGNSGAAVANRQAGRSSLQVFLDKMQPKAMQALTDKMDPDAFMLGIETAIRKTPRLLQCTESSLFIATATCAEAGLVPLYDLAYLIPRYNKDLNSYEAHFQFGYRGLIDMLTRSGRVAGVDSETVREDDEFSVRRGLHPDIVHVPALTVKERPITHVYAIAWPTDPNAKPWFEVMSHAQVEHIRKVSADAKSPAWRNHWGQMARKTAIRRLCNYIPLRADDRKLLEKDDEAAFDFDAEEHHQVEGVTRTEKVEALIAAGDPEPPKDGPVETPDDPDLATLEQMAGVDDEKRAEILADIEGDPESDPRAYKAYRDRLSGIVDQNMEREA